MQDRGINPYQPVVLDSGSSDDDSACEVGFRLTHGLLRHAEAQYLLHWHPGRLLFGSLAMIAASCIGIWASMQFGTIIFLLTLIAMMVSCSLIYLALVHRSKVRIRQRQREHGLVHGAACTVILDDDRLRLESAVGAFHWPSETMKVYRSKKGLLLCPDPLLFIFVPKQTDSSREAFDLFRRKAESNASPAPRANET